MFSREYVAGFFDGEGSIGVYPTKRHGRDRYYLRTQVTQNVGVSSERLLTSFVATYGGNLGVMKGARGTPAYNWQLNGSKAAAFLQEIEPLLQLKRDQARIAIAWQRQRPAVVRNERGHIVYTEPPVLTLDRGVCDLIRALKKADIEEVLTNQSDLVEVVHTLKQVLCVKG